MTITPVRLVAEVIESERPQLVVTAFCARRPPVIAAPGGCHLHLSISDLVAGAAGECPSATSADIARLLETVAALPRPRSVVTACLAGISRSSALALVIAEALEPGGANRAWSLLQASGRGFTPNPDVLAAAAIAFGDRPDLEQLSVEAMGLPRPVDADLGGCFAFQL